MIETIIRDYLMSGLDVPVYVSVPAGPPDSYVVIERTGGTEENHIRSATVAIQSYAATMYDAATLHESVLEAVKGMIELDSISSVEVNAEYNFTDTSTRQPRYQAVFDFVYY